VGIFPSFKKIIQKHDTFILGTLLVLSIDYLVLFFVESILPGYVMSNFNLNFLLLFILLGWLLVFFNSKGKVALKLSKIYNFIFLALIVSLFVIGTWFALYNAKGLEILFITAFLFVIGYFLYKD